MSYEKRQGDIDKLKVMVVGEEIELNMFQEGGSEIKRVSPYTWELSEITTYGISVQFYGSYTEDTLDKLVDVVYDVLT